MSNKSRLRTIFVTVLATIALIVGQTAWAQSLSGSGTEDDPWVINSTNDWNTFAGSSSFWGSDMFVKLAADITVCRTVGTSASNCFKGSFNGGGHTLTFNFTAITDLAAPFAYINGATFKRLKVTGTINSGNYKFAAGIASHSSGNCTIQNCWSNISVISTISGDATHAGFVAVQDAGSLDITNCLFDGSITGNNTNRCAGFVGWREGSSSLTFTNCLMAGTLAISLDNNSATFNRNGGSTLTNSYYKGTFTDVVLQGTQTDATGSTLQGLLSNDDWEVIGDNVIPILFPDPYNLAIASIRGKSIYKYTGSPITVNYKVIDADGKELKKGTDYTEIIVPSLVQNIGDYTLTVTGAGSYSGSKTFNFSVADILLGAGTQADPYRISSADDWTIFVAMTESSSCTGQYFMLTDDISVSTMASDNGDYEFRGNFNGIGHKITLTLNCTTPYTGDVEQEQGLALFRMVGKGCNIRNLTVDGTITTVNKFAAGFISYILGPKSITSTGQYKDVMLTNCRSSVSIISTRDGDATSAGFVGLAKSFVELQFHNCLFDGSFSSSTATQFSGFVGWHENLGYAKYYNCLVAPTSINLTATDGNHRTFSRFSPSYLQTLNNSYYRTAIGTTQGTNASGDNKETLRSKLGDGWQISGDDVIPVPMNWNINDGSISDLTTVITYTGFPINVTYNVKDAYGKALTKDSDYTESFDPSPVQNTGDYTLTVTGTGSYTGTKTITFTVVPSIMGSGSNVDPYIVNSWTQLMEKMEEGGYIQLGADVADLEKSSSSYLYIPNGKTVYLDLNGHTIDRGAPNVSRGYVINVAGNLTVLDSSNPSTGKIKGGKNKETIYSYGGGVYNSGTFTLAGGTICDNVNGVSCGLYGAGVYNTGTFNMTGGAITGHHTKESQSGGAGVYNTGTFTMSGGTISDNSLTNTSSTFGGGVYNSGTFTMTGGTITGNKSNNKGGGVYNNGTFNVSGDPVITGNTHDLEQENVFLANNKVITITGSLSNDTPIGVTMNAGTGTFTSGLTTYNVSLDKFATDNTGYEVLLSATEAALAVPSPENLAFATITDLKPYYLWDNGNAISIGNYTVIPKDGNTPLIPDVDFTVTLNGTDITNVTSPTVSAKGNYSLVITAKDGNANGFFDSKTFNFTVGDGITVTSGITEMTNAIYMLTEDVTITSRISINGMVELVLGEGKTLTAEKGIELQSGRTLTISGSGTLTVTSPDTYKSGIGANGYGTLIINSGTVNATGGAQAAGLGGDSQNNDNTDGHIIINGGVVNATSGYGAAAIGGGANSQPGTIVIRGGKVTTALATGGNSYGIGKGYNAATSGSLTLGWTNETDFVNVNSYNIPSISFVPGKAFYFSGTTTLVTTDNIRGGTLVPNTTDPADLSKAIISVTGTNSYKEVAYTGSVIAYSVKNAIGVDLLKDTDYTLDLTCNGSEVSEINDVGSYTLTITATGSYYTNTKSIEFFVYQDWEGSGTSSAPYLIANSNQLDLLARRVNRGYNIYSCFKLVSDITYTHKVDNEEGADTENNYIPIGNNDQRFSGFFDGDGHTIRGIRISGGSYRGLFGYVNGGTVKNVTLADARISGGYATGGIAGDMSMYSNAGLIDNCHVTNTVILSSTSSNLGGIAGVSSATISACTSAAQISSNNAQCGGIVGYVTSGGTLQNCIVNGAIINNTYYRAGVITGSKNDNATMTANYYLNVTFNGTVNATNVGIGVDGYQIDIDGARSVHTLTLGDNVNVVSAGTVVIGPTTYYISGSTVTLSYSGVIPQGRKLYYTVNNTTIEDNSFSMPSSDAVVNVTTKERLTITANSDTKMYDGTPLTNTGYTSVGLLSGHTISGITITGSQTNAGSCENVPGAVVIRNGSNAIVTDDYYITYENGTLTVTQKPVSITAGSASRTYNGKALIQNSYSNTALAAGDSFESVTITGSRTAAGISNNIPSDAVIRNANNDNVTGNYNISYITGSLTVNRKPVTITADSDTKEFDGNALTKNSYTHSALVKGHTISVTITGSQTNTGSSDNVPGAAVISDGSNADVTENYDITYVNGTLTVTPYVLSETSGITGTIATLIAGQDARFSRSFTENVASTICLPFNISKDQADAAGTFYEFVGVNDERTEVTMQVANITSDNPLIAHKPYLFIPSATASVTFSGIVANDVSTTAGSKTESGWLFTGTYESILWDANHVDVDKVYGFAAQSYEAPDDDNDGNADYSISPGKFVRAAAGASIAPFRAYLMFNLPNHSPMRGGYRETESLPGSMRVVLQSSDGMVSAIGSVDIATGNVTIDTWYDMSGRLLQGKPDEGGMYIHNGKKVIIK